MNALAQSSPEGATPMNPEAVDPDAKEQSRRRAQEIAALEQRAARRDAFAAFVLKCVPPLIGFALFVLVWHGIATLIPSIPTPGATWNAAVPLFADPFYRNGPNDQGIGWNVLASLARVAAGFGLAAVVGIPAGFLLGRFAFLNAMASPVISLLRPVSPLAWLPIVTMVVSAVSFFVPTPAGIGPFHFFFKEALTTFYAVPPTEALACATVVHATYNLTYLVVGGLAALAVQGRRWWQDRSTA